MTIDAEQPLVNHRLLLYEISNSSSTSLRSSLANLIDVKNKIPRYNMNLEPVPNTFKPEVTGYSEGIVYMVFVILFAAAVFFLAFLLFTISRLAFKKCGGFIKTEEVENF